MSASPEQMVTKIINELKSNDINKEYLRKAGSEIELQKTIESKFVKLRKEFDTIDTNKD